MLVEYENLAKVNEPYLADLEQAASRVIRGGWYVLGEEVKAFEEEFASYVGVKHCIGVGNGLDALVLSIEALNLPKGSDILVASNTYIATILSIIRAGHRPVLVEPDINTFNIDPTLLGGALTPGTRAICVTHLFGKCCRMEEICVFAKEHGLFIVEDCAQAHGAKLKGQMAGTFGIAGCFSFYPTKNLGAIGDAGAVVSNDDEFADRIRHLRNYGSKEKYVNKYVGYNSRLDELQAAMLRVKLRHLDKVISHKRNLASVYFEKLPPWVILPKKADDGFDVFHIYGVRVNNRDSLRHWMLSKGVKTEVHYPIPPHRQEALSLFSWPEFQISSLLHATQLSLPISSYHSTKEVDYVCEVVREFNI